MTHTTLPNDKRNIAAELEAYAELEQRAGEICGASWCESSASVQQTERLLRCNPDSCKLCDCTSDDEAIAAFMRIIVPTKATDAEFIRKFWKALRGPSPFPDRPSFIAGFLQGAHSAAWRSCRFAVPVADWLVGLSPEQRAHLREFAHGYGVEMEDDGREYIPYPACCHDAYELIFFAAHGGLPSLNRRESNRAVRSWFLDTLELDGPGCLIDSCIEDFLCDVVSEVWNHIDDDKGATAQEVTAAEEAPPN